MSSQNLQTSCKQRFKGVENFLRRVAFNLGNTPSQTDVKIISCIPIDVTDLQKKIMNLEKQLYEAKEQDHDRKINPQPPEEPKTSTDKPRAVENTALYNTPLAKQSSTVCYCSRTTNNRRQQPASIHRGDYSLRSNKSNVSFAFPDLSTAEAVQTSKADSHVSSNNIDQNTTHAAIKRYKNIFYNRKRKKDKGKGKLKTQLVYYAQTSNNPFNMHVNTRRYLSSTEAMCLSHLDNVVKKQYDPNYGVEEFSDTSNFTKPICRDTDEGLKLYESDVCSCCHGKFQNIDSYMTTSRHYDSYIFPREKEPSENTNIFYNSKDYDIIPVKENSNKTLNENLNKTETKIDIDIKCWPEKFRTKYRYHPFIVNYQTEFATKRRSPQRSELKILEMEKPKRSYRSARCKKLYQHATDTPSKSCSIECSKVYKKQPFQNIKVRKSEPVEMIIQKNELTSTDDAHQVQVNTKSADFNTAYNIKTESTLDEIKTMLQSVLAEVKTSAKLNNCIDEKARKDATVQKGASQNIMPGASTLLHSFTYNNSCNVIPYISTCSRRTPQQYCFASVPCQPVKIENFPVFVHPSPRKHTCAYHHKNNSIKQTTAATNTDKEFQESNSKVTENLIKEIYKSMALNLDSTTKENSLSECDDLKSADGSTNTSWKEIKTTGIVTNKRDVEIDAIMTPLESNSNDTKVLYTAITQADAMSQHSEQCYNAANRNTSQANVYRLEHENNIIYEDEETDQSDETESDKTEIFDHEYDNKEKKGFLQRMFKSVKLFHKKKDNQEQHQRGVEESDSDDYETIYSQQFAAPTNVRRQKNNRRNYSKVHCFYENRRERERPYLEQEHRRQWTEGLTFHYSPKKITTKKHFPKQNSTQNPFWKNYEARSVIIDNVPYNKKMVLDKYGDEAIQKDTKPKDKLGWLKKHKLGIKCGERWKNFILEN